MGAAMAGPEGFGKSNNIALSVNCSSEEEINSFFTKLAVGGNIINPLKPQFRGAIFVVVTNNFRVQWMFNYDRNRQS